MLASTAATAADPSMEERVRALEKALQAAQQQIQHLTKELEAQKGGGGVSAAAAPVAAPPAATAAAPAPAAATAEAKRPPLVSQETIESVVAHLQHFTLFGDMRLRYEGIYNRPHPEGEEIHDRDRARVRARLGLTYTYDEELSATVRIATGNPDDPISTNVTLGDAFTPKDLNLDWAFVSLTPGKTFGIRPGLLNVVGGKFPNTMFRDSEMVFDDDLALEGVAENLALLDGPHGPLERLDLHAMQWSFAEFSNGADGWMIGGQLHPRMHVGPATVEAGVGQLWWHKADLIAEQLNTNSSLVNTNAVDTMTSGGTTTITGYQSRFLQTDVTASVTFPDVLGSMPLKLTGDYVHNWQAAGEKRDGFLVGATLGKPKVRGDWYAYAFYEYLEREAAISAFTWSDFGNGGGTNQQGPTLEVGYQLLDPLVVSVKSIVANYIDRPPGQTNPTTVRLQVDAKVKF